MPPATCWLQHARFDSLHSFVQPLKLSVSSALACTAPFTSFNYRLICYSILFDPSLKDQIVCTTNYTSSIFKFSCFKQVPRSNYITVRRSCHLTKKEKTTWNKTDAEKAQRLFMLIMKINQTSLAVPREHGTSCASCLPLPDESTHFH